MLDHIMFMHCGQVVYIGPPTKVIDAFSQATGIQPVGDENPADFGLDCLRGLVHENVVGLMIKVPPETFALSLTVDPCALHDCPVGINFSGLSPRATYTSRERFHRRASFHLGLKSG
jgi:hypothetical protein